MLEQLLESLDKDVYTAEMIESVKTQFNEAVETKAKEIADVQILEAASVAADEFEKTLNETVEKAVEAAIAENTEMLTESAEIYLAETLAEKEIEFEKKSGEFIAEQLSTINESLDHYLENVVSEFLADAQKQLDESIKSEKADMLIDAFDAMVLASGVDISRIVEAKDQSDVETKLQESIEKYDNLMEDLIKVKKENTALLKSGIIAEMKDGLSMVEAKKFERLAEMVQFTRDEAFTEKLEVIKESVKGSKEEKQEIVESVTKPTNALYGSHLV